MIRDIMGNAGLAGFAEIGLAIFLTGFGLALFRVWAMSKQEVDELSHLPLEHDES